ncbi:aminotransferase class I/II-fold pyridoxal phosphate-dependent enzyme, partial [bacterium]|nr:aminotransferase class I/II-fold pyridoxal phosphate-dependent enzyme [bacterium]
SAISQHAAVEAVSNDQRDREHMREVFQTRRDLMYALVEKWPNAKAPKPEGAFYVFPRINGVWKQAGKPYPGSLAVSTQLLEEEYVATVPGAVFGDDLAIRLSFAASEETIREACGRIERYLQRQGN